MKKAISILVIAALSACGGGSSKSSTTPVPTPTPQPTNTAPIANDDIGLAQNNQPIVLDVLANDTDVESNSLSISKIITEPTMGSVAIVNNTLVYTPNKDVALVDTLQYELSDGELTSTASVAVTINHTISISGKVTDSPISNAKVSATLSGETFTTTADNEGNYKLDLTISSMIPELLIISAIGSEDRSQQNVELITVIGETISLLTAVADNREFPVVGNSTNITHVSSATYLLSIDRNKNDVIVSMATYKQFVSELDSNELMSTAGFIKLLVDNDDFDIPDGETTLSFLAENNNKAVNTSVAINSYLAENDLLGEDGQPITAYINALSAAIDETVADPDVVEQFTAEMFTNKTMIKLTSIKEGWLPYTGDTLVFSDNDYTVFYDANSYSDNPEIVYTRSIVDGKLRLKTDQFKSKLIGTLYYPFNRLADEYGFDQSVVNELIEAYHSGKIPNNLNLDMTEHVESIDYTLINSNDINYQVAIETRSYYQFDIPEELERSEDVAKSEAFTNSSNGSLIHSPAKQWLDKSLTDINGNWLLYFDENFKDYLNNFEETTAPFAKVAEMRPSNATAIVENKEYSVVLSDGVLSLNSGNKSYKIKPIQASSNAYLAIIEKWLDGKLEYAHARQIAKIDSDLEVFTNSLSAELPKVQLVYLNGSSSDAWQGDKLKLDYTYGYQLSESGDMRRGLQGFFAGEGFEDHQVDHFYLGDTRWKWSTEDDRVNLTLNTEYVMAHRTWQVISTDENGYTMVLEQSIRGFDDDNDGMIKNSEIGQFIRPRVQIIKQDDLSRWQEAWQNTVDLGLITEQSNVATKLRAESNIN